MFKANNSPISSTNVTQMLGNRCAPELEISMAATTESRWWSAETVAVVTGANRGIGLEVSRQLAEEGITVVMTARKPQAELSSSAQAFLQQGRKNVIFHTLDIDQKESVAEFVRWLKLTTEFVDILINNAGTANNEVEGSFMRQNNVDSATVIERCVRTAEPQVPHESEGSGIRWIDGVPETTGSATRVIGTNYYGTVRLTEALLPLLRPPSSSSSLNKPRIVNVSSFLGMLCLVRDEGLRKELSEGETLTEEKIEGMLETFLEDVHAGKDLTTSGATGWPLQFPSYSLSKVALNAYTRVLARRMEGKACVNAVHPGYVKTDMTLGTGDISAAQGAANLVRVALFSPDEVPSGHFFLEAKDSQF